MSLPFEKQRVRSFLIIWIGQLFSLMGTSLSGFALGVWVYQLTGSVTQFSLILLFTTLPGILILPLAGALVDRWDRRWTMIISDSVAGLSTLILALLLFVDRLDVWHIYIMTAISSTFNAFQWPAYTALTTQLVPSSYLGRASGMVQFAQALAQLIAPLLGGVLIAFIGIEGVLFIDVTTFLIALTTLLVVRTPRSEAATSRSAQEQTLFKDIAYGWNYLLARTGLLALLLFFAVSNFVNGIVQALLTPLLLSFTTVTVLGTVLSIAGSGMLVGSLTMALWGGPQRRIQGILGFTFLRGLCLVIGGLRPDLLLITVSAFLFMFCLPIGLGCSQAIWQTKVAPEVQGRVFAMRAMIAWSSQPLAFVVAGPLADRLFEPLMASNGLFAGTVGSIIGTGAGRGIALLFILAGVLMIAVSVCAYWYPRLRYVETELPDITRTDTQTDVEPAQTASA